MIDREDDSDSGRLVFDVDPLIRHLMAVEESARPVAIAAPGRAVDDHLVIWRRWGRLFGSWAIPWISTGRDAHGLVALLNQSR